MKLADFRLPAEWEAQDALIMAWPTAGTDWHPVLDRIQHDYLTILDIARAHQPVILLVDENDDDAERILGRRDGLETVRLRYNDTWCRDYGPLVMCSEGRRLALDFHFNGWGGKFEARLDNRVNASLAALPRFSDFEFRQSLFELEGGAIEGDGRTTLLINRHCFRSRHPQLDDAEVEEQLKTWFNVTHLIEIDMPPMPGDDTDGHIDTLVRFAGTGRLVFQEQRDPGATRTLLGQLEALRDADDRPFELVSMPVPEDVDAALPASYVNYIVVNGAVILPQFGSRCDQRAIGIAAELFEDREIHGVDAVVMAGQGGGPHCASMHIPADLP